MTEEHPNVAVLMRFDPRNVAASLDALAARAASPRDVSSQCVVFAESEVVGLIHSKAEWGRRQSGPQWRRQSCLRGPTWRSLGDR